MSLKQYGCIISDPAWRFNDTNGRGAAEKHYTPDAETGRSTMSTEEILQLPVDRLALPDAHLKLWTTAAHMDIALDLMRFWNFTFKCAVVWVKTTDIITRIRDGKPRHYFTLKAMNELLEADAKPPELSSRDVAEFVPDYAQIVESSISVTIGGGHYYRHATELCLFGARGSCVARDGAKGIPNVVFAPRTREHSEKPKIIHEFAELMSPTPFLEMFAREPFNEKWDVWGNDPKVKDISINLGPYAGTLPNL